MSLFTAGKLDQQPPCPRCGSPQFVRLVRQGDEFSTFNCTKCGPIAPVRQPSSKS